MFEFTFNHVCMSFFYHRNEQEMIIIEEDKRIRIKNYPSFHFSYFVLDHKKKKKTKQWSKWQKFSSQKDLSLKLYEYFKILGFLLIFLIFTNNFHILKIFLEFSRIFENQKINFIYVC